MDYGKEILGKLIDMFERRGAYEKDASSLRAIQIDVNKDYPEYKNRYDHVAYRDINAAIENLIGGGYVFAETDNTGYYKKIKLNVEQVMACYKKLKRKSIPELCQKVISTLEPFINSESALVRKIAADFMMLAQEHRKLPYDLKYNEKRTSEILTIIEVICKLEKETYIRNFSTALFKDSKRFQKEFRTTIESILFDYTDSVVEKDKILEYYNLYLNPTYVLIKGDVTIMFDTSVIHVSEMPGGIALSNASLDNIKSVVVNTGKVISVENLTSYHDLNDSDAVHFYLGGYHNSSKQKLLEKLYENNKDCSYYHKGDLDVYGFLILENLKAKTGIPFQALKMDVATLERFYRTGLYKELSANDVKVINAKKDTQLVLYANVLEFMLRYNCKVEQESLKAVELLE